MSTSATGFDRFCGPAALSVILGISRERAADTLRSIQKSNPRTRRLRHATNIDAIARAVTSAGCQVRDRVRHYRVDGQPTVARWLKGSPDRPRGIWLVLAARHFLVVRDGVIIADNGVRPMRGRVSEVFRVEFPAQGSSTAYSADRADKANPPDNCLNDNPAIDLSRNPQNETTKEHQMSITAALPVRNATNRCACDDHCLGTTTRLFTRGHDARLVSRLRDAVLKGELDHDQARAEVNRRAGAVSPLILKLDRAIENALARRSGNSSKGSAKTGPRKAWSREIRTVDGYRVDQKTASVRPVKVECKIGRWAYEGTLTRYTLADDAAETIETFTYTDRKGETRETTKFVQVASDN